MSNQNHTNKTIPLNDLVRISEAAEVFGVSRATFFELRKRPGFPTPYHITSKLIVFSRKELLQWVGGRKAKPIYEGCIDNVHLQTRESASS